MQNERYPLNCCRNFSNRRDDIFAACEQLMPEGDVIYGDFEGTERTKRTEPGWYHPYCFGSVPYINTGFLTLGAV